MDFIIIKSNQCSLQMFHVVLIELKASYQGLLLFRQKQLLDCLDAKICYTKIMKTFLEDITQFIG